MAGISPIVSWLVFPFYVVAGLYVRARTPRFPPAPGSVSGRVSINSAEAPLRLLVIGDSSAAAVGLSHQGDGLASQLAQALALRTKRSVEWRAAGFNSATSGQLRDYVVPNLEVASYTHIFLSVGFNDLKNFHSRSRFLREFGTLIYAIKARFPESRLYWSEVLEPEDVPGLPWYLSKILKLRLEVLNPLGRCLCRERGAVAVPAMQGLVPKAFCSDGIHPSEAGFQNWAEHIVDRIAAAEAETPSV